MKPVVVIGGSGFIGKQVVSLLLEKGREVISVSRTKADKQSISGRLLCIQSDYGNISFLERLATKGCEIINLAYSTVPKTSFNDPTFDLLSNVPQNVALIQAAARCEVGRLLIVSSGGTVYGEASYLPINEEHPTNPISPYGITKLTIEAYARMFNRTNRLPLVIVRPGNAYGPLQRIGTGQGFIAAAISAILNRKEIEIYGAHGTIRDYIHVEDVARGIVAALEHGHDGEIYNIGTGVGSSNLDIVKLLKTFAERDGYNVFVKRMAARLFDVKENILNADKLHEQAGWEPSIGLSEGLNMMWEEAMNPTKTK